MINPSRPTLHSWHIYIQHFAIQEWKPMAISFFTTFPVSWIRRTHSHKCSAPCFISDMFFAPWWVIMVHFGWHAIKRQFLSFYYPNAFLCSPCFASLFMMHIMGESRRVGLSLCSILLFERKNHDILQFSVRSARPLILMTISPLG